MLTNRYYKEDYEQETLVGTLVQMQLKQGTLSEGMVCVLEGDFGQTPVIFSDGPLAQKSFLEGIIGTSVHVTGEWQQGIFYVKQEDVQKVEDKPSTEEIDDLDENKDCSSNKDALEEDREEINTELKKDPQHAEGDTSKEDSCELSMQPIPEKTEHDQPQLVELVVPCRFCSALSHEQATYCWNCSGYLDASTDCVEET